MMPMTCHADDVAASGAATVEDCVVLARLAQQTHSRGLSPRRPEQRLVPLVENGQQHLGPASGCPYWATRRNRRPEPKNSTPGRVLALPHEMSACYARGPGFKSWLQLLADVPPGRWQVLMQVLGLLHAQGKDPDRISKPGFGLAQMLWHLGHEPEDGRSLV